MSRIDSKAMKHLLFVLLMAAACSRTSLPASTEAGRSSPRDAGADGPSNAGADGPSNAGPDLAAPDIGGPDQTINLPDLAPLPDTRVADTNPARPEVSGLAEVGSPDLAPSKDARRVEAGPGRGEVGSPDVASPADTHPMDARHGLSELVAGGTFSIQSSTPAPTPDPGCTARAGADAYMLSFSADSTTVTVVLLAETAFKPMHGTLVPESARLTYHLDGGVDGGIVSLELDQGQVVAQLTLYGSGVPVIACVRAPLSPQP